MRKLFIIVLVGLIVALGLSPSAPKVNPYQDLYEDLLYPTVKVSTKTGTGSGVVISNEYILTAAHVVEDYSSVSVTFYSYCHEDTKTLSASVVITDTNKDLALLTTNAHESTRIYSARLAPRDYVPYIFTPVWTVGCSLGLKPRPSFGHITAISPSPYPLPRGERIGEGEYFWEISAPILPGNSGGGVFDARTNELIGIAVWAHTYRGQLITTMGGIVPIQSIYEFLDETLMKIPTLRLGLTRCNGLLPSKTKVLTASKNLLMGW